MWGMSAMPFLLDTKAQQSHAEAHVSPSGYLIRDVCDKIWWLQWVWAKYLYSKAANCHVPPVNKKKKIPNYFTLLNSKKLNLFWPFRKLYINLNQFPTRLSVPPHTKSCFSSKGTLSAVVYSKHERLVTSTAQKTLPAHESEEFPQALKIILSKHKTFMLHRVL